MPGMPRYGGGRRARKCRPSPTVRGCNGMENLVELGVTCRGTGRVAGRERALSYSARRRKAASDSRARKGAKRRSRGPAGTSTHSRGAAHRCSAFGHDLHGVDPPVGRRCRRNRQSSQPTGSVSQIPRQRRAASSAVKGKGVKGRGQGAPETVLV